MKRNILFFVALLIVVSNFFKVNLNKYKNNFVQNTTYNTSNVKFNIDKSLNHNLSKVLDARNVIIQNDTNIDYSYNLYYDKYIYETDNNVNETSGDSNSLENLNNTTFGLYVNGKINSKPTSGTKDIGGVPKDKISGIEIKINLPNSKIEPFTNKIDVNKLSANTIEKSGSEYFILKASDGKDDLPVITLFKAYLDVLTNKRCEVAIGNYKYAEKKQYK